MLNNDSILAKQPKLKELLLATVKAFNIPEWNFAIERAETQGVESFCLTMTVGKPVSLSLCFGDGTAEDLSNSHPYSRNAFEDALAIWGVSSMSLKSVEIYAEPNSAVDLEEHGYAVSICLQSCAL